MAKEQKQEPAPALAPDNAETLGPPKSYRLQTTLALVGLILFQMIVLWLLLPPRQDLQGRYGTGPTDIPKDFEDAPSLPTNIGDREKSVERPINEGKPLVIKETQNDALVTFSLTMSVSIREKDAVKFDKQYGLRKQEIIDRVETVLSKSSTEERHEIGRTTIKEKSKKAINEVLGFNFVQQVFVSGVVNEVQ